MTISRSADSLISLCYLHSITKARRPFQPIFSVFFIPSPSSSHWPAELFFPPYPRTDFTIVPSLPLLRALALALFATPSFDRYIAPSRVCVLLNFLLFLFPLLIMSLCIALFSLSWMLSRFLFDAAVARNSRSVCLFSFSFFFHLFRG